MKYKIGKKTVDVKSASGVSGCLLNDFGRGGQFLFRVYRGKRFTDYRIDHYDLSVTIEEKSDAAFYDNGKEKWLDYDPRMLELKKVKKKKRRK